MSDLLITQNVPTRDLVLQKLRQAILSGRFPPGTRLVERELVTLTGVSRTPIREALRKLELEGLVIVVPYKGPAVSLPSLDDARELYEVRAALEGKAVELFAGQADEAALGRLRTCVQRAAAALRSGDLPGLLAANNAFHDEVASGCGNTLLQAMIANLRNRIVLLRVESLSHAGRPPRSLTEHRAILRALARRDAVAARTRLEAHIMRAWRAAHAELVAHLRGPATAAPPARDRRGRVGAIGRKGRSTGMTARRRVKA